MKFTFSIEGDTETDKDKIEALFKAIQTTEVKPTEQPITSKVLFPKIHGKGKETVFAIIERFEPVTRAEMYTKTDISEASINNYIFQLKTEKIIDTTTEKPVKYFIKAHGNPNMKEMLTKGKVVNHMG